SVSYPVSAELSKLVEHANSMVEARRGRLLANHRRSADQGVSEDQLWGELGHLLTVLDRSVQTLQHDLSTTRDAYESLLTQLYPANEVFVVAEKPADDGVHTGGNADAIDEAS